MKADIVVIGAGALGLSTALHCALLGRSVIVVERDTAGSQASGRAAGLFKSVQADEQRTALARRSIDLAVTLRRLGRSRARGGPQRQLPGRADRQAPGLPAGRGHPVPRLGRGRAAGQPLRTWLAGCPSTAATTRARSSRCGAQRTSTSRSRSAWCGRTPRHCRRHGVEILESEAVVGIPFSGGRAAGVETEARSIDAGGRRGGRGGRVGPAGRRARRGRRPGGDRAGPAPAADHRAVRRGRPGTADHPGRRRRGVLAPGAGRPDVRRVRGRAAAGRSCRSSGRRSAPTTCRWTSACCGTWPRQVADEAPLAGAARVAEHRGGLFTMSPDGRFVVGPVPDAPGLWVASGCNGSGFSSSPAIGEALAALDHRRRHRPGSRRCRRTGSRP